MFIIHIPCSLNETGITSKCRIICSITIISFTIRVGTKFLELWNWIPIPIPIPELWIGIGIEHFFQRGIWNWNWNWSPNCSIPFIIPYQFLSIPPLKDFIPGKQPICVLCWMNFIDFNDCSVCEKCFSGIYIYTNYII